MRHKITCYELFGGSLAFRQRLINWFYIHCNNQQADIQIRLSRLSVTPEEIKKNIRENGEVSKFLQKKNTRVDYETSIFTLLNRKKFKCKQFACLSWTSMFANSTGKGFNLNLKRIWCLFITSCKWSWLEGEFRTAASTKKNLW